MAFDDRLHFGKIDFVVFADHRARFILGKRQAAMAALRGTVIFNQVRRFGQIAGMPLVPCLGAPGTRPIPLRLSIGRRWFRRCPRGLVRTLQAQNQLYQLRIRKPLEFIAIHR